MKMHFGKLFKTLAAGAVMSVFGASATNAATVDLTMVNAVGSINGGRFDQVAYQPSGTGVLQSFVRLQSQGNSTTEKGYNTDGRPLLFDENNSPIFTRSLLLNNVPIIEVGGIDYRQFLLDINEPQSENDPSASLISLDAFKIFLGTAGNLLQNNPNDLGTLVYDLDAGGNNSILLDSALNPGSGTMDMYAYIPTALFASVFNGTNSYVYLYSEFGLTQGAEGGFEEWAIFGGHDCPVIPLPPAVWSGASVLGLLALGGLKKKISILGLTA